MRIQRLRNSESDDPALHMDSEQEVRLQCLRAAIERLVDDGTELEYPPDLARRTVAFVARNRRRPFSLLDYVPVSLPFRWADFAVAASIFIAGTLTLLPAIQRSRERMNQAGCVFNLQQLGKAWRSMRRCIDPCRIRRHTGPTLTRECSRSFFTTRVCSITSRSSIARAMANLRTVSKELASFEQVDQIRRTDPEAYRRMLCWDYAYNVGYRHRLGARRPARSRPLVTDPCTCRPARSSRLPDDS